MEAVFGRERMADSLVEREEALPELRVRLYRPCHRHQEALGRGLPESLRAPRGGDVQSQAYLRGTLQYVYVVGLRLRLHAQPRASVLIGR